MPRRRQKGTHKRKDVVGFYKENGKTKPVTLRSRVKNFIRGKRTVEITSKLNLSKEAKKNKDYRRVLRTAKHSQLVVMNLRPNEEIGEETHPQVDQFLRFERGKGQVVINGVAQSVKGGDVVVVSAGIKHNVINTSNRSELKLSTIYSPPEHGEGEIEHSKIKEEKESAKEAESD